MSVATTNTACKACGANVPDGATNCPRCGTSQLMDTCPLCGATTGMSPDPTFRYRCDVCGGPRIPMQAPRKRRTAKESAALKRADVARKTCAKYRAGAVAAGLSFVGVAGLLALASIISLVAGWNLGLWIAIAGLFTAGPLAALTAWLVSRASARDKEIPIAIDEAWMAAALDVIEQGKKAVTANDLAKALGIDESQAEEILALLEASDIVRPDGNFAYRSRLRIDASTPQPTSDNLAAEAEAQAEAEALEHQQSAKRERV